MIIQSTITRVIKSFIYKSGNKLKHNCRFLLSVNFNFIDITSYTLYEIYILYVYIQINLYHIDSVHFSIHKAFLNVRHTLNIYCNDII